MNQESYKYMYICIYVYVYAYVSMCKCIYVHVPVCIYICICICICVTKAYIYINVIYIYIYIYSDAAAAIGHKYTKVPLGRGKADLLGSSKARDCQLQDQVDVWSRRWQEDQGPGDPAFPAVPWLPPIAIADVVKAS